MDVLTLFFVTQSIYAILASIFLVLLITFIVVFIRDLKQMSEKAHQAIDESIETANEAKAYVNKIGSAILDYFVLKITKTIKRKEK